MVTSMLAVSALVLHANDLDKSVAFYRGCGVGLVERRHGGPVHFACAVGGVHVSVYASVHEQPPQTGTALGLTVADLQGAVTALKLLGATVIEEARPRPWGVSAILQDPDGRRVELLGTHTEMTGPLPR